MYFIYGLDNSGIQLIQIMRKKSFYSSRFMYVGIFNQKLGYE